MILKVSLDLWVDAPISLLENNLSMCKLECFSPAGASKGVNFTYTLYLTNILVESELKDLKSNL